MKFCEYFVGRGACTHLPAERDVVCCMLIKGGFAGLRERNLPRSFHFSVITGIRVEIMVFAFFKCDFWIPGEILDRFRWMIFC